MLTTAPEFFTFVALGLVVGLVVLLALQILTSMRVQKLTYPVYEYAQAKAQAEVDRILNDAKAEAQRITAKAQESAAAFLDSQRADVEGHSREYQGALEKLVQSTEHSFSELAQKSTAESAKLRESLSQGIQAQGAQFKSTMDEIEKDLRSVFEATNKQAQEMQRSLEAQRMQASGDLARLFDGIADEGKKQVKEQIEAFSKKVEAEVAEYRDGRKRIIDENMANIVAEATKLVLQKTLSQEEHAQLVQRALKEARTSGML